MAGKNSFAKWSHYWFSILCFLLVSVWFIFYLTGCSVIEVKQDHYRRDFGKIPVQQENSLQSIGAVATGATEINKGLNWVYYEGVQPLNDRVKALLDFSYSVMGWLGVAWDEINWENPEEYFQQIENQKEKLSRALEEKEELKLKYEEEKKQFLHNLAEKDEVIEDKDAEMKARDGEWSVRFSWWVRFFVWIIVIILVLVTVIWIYKGVVRWLSGLPFKVAMFGTKTVSKGFKQLVQGVQEARLELKNEMEKGDESVKKVWNILHEKLNIARDEKVHNLIKDVKNKNKMKSTREKKREIQEENFSG